MTTLTKEISLQRRTNRQRVYKSLYYSKLPQTKKELGVNLELSFPTVNQNVTELCTAGLIQETKSTNFTGGRHASVLEVVKDSHYSIGVSINDINLRFVLTNIKFEEVFYKKIFYKFDSFEKEIGDFLAVELEKFIVESNIEKSKILGVGIAVPAIVNKEKQEIGISPTLKIKKLPFSALTKKIPYKTFIENDGSAGGFCEFFLKHSSANMAYISLENGVGGAIIINNKEFCGDNVKAGEFGHICVETDGLACSCGKKGCLEAYCNARRFSNDLGITLLEFGKELENGNKKYKKMWKDMLKHLATAIVNIRKMLDCPVVLGGILVPLVTPYFDTLKEYVQENLYGDTDTDFVSLCQKGNKSVSLGVSLHFIQEFINKI